MKKLIILVALIYGAETYAMSVYKCKTDIGNYSYQDKPCENQKASMLETKGITDEESHQNALKITSGDLGQYQVTMLTFNWWKAFKKEVSDDFLHFKFTDDSGDTKISLLIDFRVPKNDQKINQIKLKEMALDRGKVFAPLSVSKTTELTPLQMENGFGYYAEYTDPSLVGKSSYPPGEYLHTTQGLISKDGVVVNFTLLSNDLEAENHLFAIQFLTHGFFVQQGKEINKEDSSLLDRAFTAYYDGDISKAIWLFEELVAESPDEFKSWIGYCLALRDKNRLQMALVACDKALGFKPNDPDVLNSILNILIKGRQYEKGLEVANQLIETTVKKQVLDTINNLGFYAMLDNDLAVARKALEMVKREGGANRKIMIDLAVLNHKEGDSQKALELLRSIKVEDQAETQLIKRYMDTITSGNAVYPAQTNQESYVNIPNQLLNIGENKLNKGMVSSWVKRTYPIIGIGKVQVETPENWMEGVQHQKLNDITNRLSLKMGDPMLEKSMVTIDVGKVDGSWSLSDTSTQMKNGLKLFFKDENLALKPLTGKSKGFSYEALSNIGDDNMYVTSKKQLIGIIAIGALSVNTDTTDESKQIVARIMSSIKLLEADQTPLLNTVENTKESGEGSIKPQVEFKELELPKAPEGFDWVSMPKARAAFLKPHEWFEINKSTKDAVTYAISKEQIKESEEFETGLTMMAVKDIASKISMTLLQYSLEMLLAVESDSDNTIIDQDIKKQGPFDSAFIKYQNNPSGLKPIIIHKMIISNEKTGSLYIVIFEAPADEWDEAWKVGEVMLKKFFIDDSF